MTEVMIEYRRGKIDIYLPGIVKMLGIHLFSDSTAALRELIQNANDSLVARRTQDAQCPEQLNIRLRIHRSRGPSRRTILEIRDNGSGMTEEEVVRFLSTVGSSHTAEIRKALENRDTEMANLLVGRFGIGILSAFVVADSVIIQTRSYLDSEPGLEWRCDGSAEYSLTEVENLPVGTAVLLDLQSNQEGFTNEHNLARLVRRHANYISFPIYISDGQAAINEQAAPWHCNGSIAEYVDCLRRRLKHEPIAVFPVEILDGSFSANGVLYVSRHPGRDHGGAELYVSRMYVGYDSQLLPDWAPFASAIVDTPSIGVTMSREAPIRDGTYGRMQQLIANHLMGALRMLAGEDPARLKYMIEVHERGVKRGALRSEQLFDLVIQHITFGSSDGPITLPAYSERISRRGAKKKKIYYHMDGVESRQHQLLFAANSSFAVMPLGPPRPGGWSGVLWGSAVRVE